VDSSAADMFASKHSPVIKQDGSPQSQIRKKQIALGIAGRETYRAPIHEGGGSEAATVHD